MDYEFTVIIDGVSNKVKGTIDNPVNYNLLLGNSNIPTSFYSTNSESLSIKDISHPNYVEGYPFSLTINFENNILGKVGASLFLATRVCGFLLITGINLIKKCTL